MTTFADDFNGVALDEAVWHNYGDPLPPLSGGVVLRDGDAKIALSVLEFFTGTEFDLRWSVVALQPLTSNVAQQLLMTFGFSWRDIPYPEVVVRVGWDPSPDEWFLRVFVNGGSTSSDVTYIGAALPDEFEVRLSIDCTSGDVVATINDGATDIATASLIGLDPEVDLTGALGADGDGWEMFSNTHDHGDLTDGDGAVSFDWVTLDYTPLGSEEPSDVSFDASTSSGTDLTYEWDFGEGNGTGTGVNPTHSFPVGTHTVTLTVTDSVDRSDVVSHEVILE